MKWGGVRETNGSSRTRNRNGQSAARVTGPCFAMGQAAGTLAALAGNGRLRDVPSVSLQSALRADGAWLGDGAPPPE